MKRLGSIIGILTALCTSAAYADTVLLTLTFDHIVEDGDGAAQLANGATGEAQLFVDVVDIGVANQVLFVARNAGPALSFIDGIYFDDGTLLGISEIQNGSGVLFSAGASPDDLPGGGLVGFETTAGFLADRDKSAANGVDSGEQLGILFDLIHGQTAQSIVNALYLDPATTGSLRVGLKVQGFSLGGGQDSESFVSNPPPVIPLPAAVWSGMALFGLIGARRMAHRHERATL